VPDETRIVFVEGRAAREDRAADLRSGHRVSARGGAARRVRANARGGISLSLDDIVRVKGCGMQDAGDRERTVNECADRNYIRVASTIAPSATATSVVAINSVRRLNRKLIQGIGAIKANGIAASQCAQCTVKTLRKLPSHRKIIGSN
jgi:hypothetical protein